MACLRAAASHAAANIAKEETINHPRDYEYESIGPKGVAVSDARLISVFRLFKEASVVRASERIELPIRLVGFAVVFFTGIADGSGADGSVALEGAGGVVAGMSFCTTVASVGCLSK